MGPIDVYLVRSVIFSCPGSSLTFNSFYSVIQSKNPFQGEKHSWIVNLGCYFWLLQRAWWGQCGSRFEGKFEEMNATDPPVDTLPSAIATSQQHENTPLMEELGRSMSELGPLGKPDASIPSSELTNPHNDPASGIMKIMPAEVTVSACFLHPLFIISILQFSPWKCFRRWGFSKASVLVTMFFVYLEAARNVSLDCGSSLFMNCLSTNFHCLLGLLQMDTDYWFLSDVSVGITDIWKNDSILLPDEFDRSNL